MSLRYKFLIWFLLKSTPGCVVFVYGNYFLAIVFMCHKKRKLNKICGYFIYIAFKKLESAILGICLVLRLVCIEMWTF